VKTELSSLNKPWGKRLSRYGLPFFRRSSLELYKGVMYWLRTEFP
jgi:hypothetical protein